MSSAPIPSDEPERLAALRALRALGLNNEPEERFDRIARVCQCALDVPIALITLLDEGYQWYKSCIGIDIRGCHRDESFCAFTILSDEPLIVSDTLADPRFSDNPMVLGHPCIRFYAGIPLHSSDGYRVGALCVIDTKPRTLSRRELEIMRSLAAIVEGELNNLSEESRRARRAAEQASIAKSQFLANISHEIRTSLNGIIGMSSMLMLTGLSDDQRRYASTIDSSGRVLLTLVNQILDFSKFDAEAAPAPAGQPSDVSPPARPLRILIAEDNAINQLVLSEQLQTLGHTSVAVSNGVEALEAMENSDWDAILLDCQMPVMDGYETVAAIRRAEQAEAGAACRTWVIAVTANALDGEREDCLRAGMDDFLSKPYHFKQLAEVISRIPAPSAHQPAPASRPAVEASLLSDLANSKATTGENLLEKMTALFTESGPQLLDQIDDGLLRDDFEAAARAVHKLAGGCGYFGAQDLHTLCIDFERLNRAGDHDALRSLAPRIREEYIRVVLALRSNADSGDN